MSSFYVASGDAASGPCSYTTCTLSTKPVLSPASHQLLLRTVSTVDVMSHLEGPFRCRVWTVYVARSLVRLPAALPPSLSTLDDIIFTSVVASLSSVTPPRIFVVRLPRSHVVFWPLFPSLLVPLLLVHSCPQLPVSLKPVSLLLGFCPTWDQKSWVGAPGITHKSVLGVGRGSSLVLVSRDL